MQHTQIIKNRLTCSLDLVKLILFLNYLNYYLFFISDTILWFTSCFFIQIWTRHSIIGRLKKYETGSDLGPCFSAKTSTETPGRPLWNLTVQWCFCNIHNKKVTLHKFVLKANSWQSIKEWWSNSVLSYTKIHVILLKSVHCLINKNVCFQLLSSSTLVLQLWLLLLQSRDWGIISVVQHIIY